MTRTRGDALQLVGMDTVTGAATSIGIPRDSYVSIPGVGSDRINAALYYGGPQLLGEAVGDLVGIEPDYVMVTRFPFFENMINDIGGIAVDNPRFFSDYYLKPQGFEAGEITLNGYGAMAFSRIRKSLPAGDFDRSANQQIVLRGIQARVAERADQTGFLASGVLTVMKHLDVSGVGPAELFRLAVAVAQVDPGRSPAASCRGASRRSTPPVSCCPTSSRPGLRRRRPRRRGHRRSGRPGHGARGADRAPPAGFEPAAPGTGNQCSIP